MTYQHHSNRCHYKYYIFSTRFMMLHVFWNIKTYYEIYQNHYKTSIYIYTTLYNHSITILFSTYNFQRTFKKNTTEKKKKTPTTTCSRSLSSTRSPNCCRASRPSGVDSTSSRPSSRRSSLTFSTTFFRSVSEVPFSGEPSAFSAFILSDPKGFINTMPS